MSRDLEKLIATVKRAPAEFADSQKVLTLKVVLEMALTTDDMASLLAEAIVELARSRP